MKAPKMFYRHPGSRKIHGDMFDYTIIDGADNAAVEAVQAAGWYPTTVAAKAAGGAAAQAPEALEEAPKVEAPKPVRKPKGKATK